MKIVKVVNSKFDYEGARITMADLPKQKDNPGMRTGSSALSYQDSKLFKYDEETDSWYELS